jgi:hypothetical protein
MISKDNPRIADFKRADVTATSVTSHK